MLLTRQVAGGRRKEGMRDPTRASFPKREKRVVAVFGKEQVRLSNAKMRSPTPERMQKRKRERSLSRDRVLAKGTPVNTELRVLIKSAKQRRQKARQRQKRFAQRMRATRGELSILETKSVKDPQKRDYLRRLEEFYDFISHHEIDIKDEVKLDEALCEYNDHMFLNGESNSSGQKLKAALEFCRPESVRKGELHLPRFKRAFERLETHGSYTDSSPHDRIYQRSNRWSHAIPEPSRHGPLQRVDFLDLRPSGRDAEGPGGGCDSEEPAVPSRCHSSGTFRKRGRRARLVCSTRSSS